jgi:hypothetical protein
VSVAAIGSIQLGKRAVIRIAYPKGRSNMACPSSERLHHEQGGRGDRGTDAVGGEFATRAEPASADGRRDSNEKPAVACRFRLGSTFAIRHASTGGGLRRRIVMNNIIYIIGLVVVVVAVLSFFGLR